MATGTSPWRRGEAPGTSPARPWCSDPPSGSRAPKRRASSETGGKTAAEPGEAAENTPYARTNSDSLDRKLPHVKRFCAHVLDQVRSLALLHCETTWSMFCGQGLECEDGVQESKTSLRVWDLNGKLHGCPSSMSQQNAGLPLVFFVELSNFGSEQHSRARTCAAPHMPIKPRQRHLDTGL